MRKIISTISYIVILFALAGCKNKSIPDKMPADFKIEFNYSGGMVDEYRSITIQTGECKDKGRYHEEDFEYTFTITNKKELEELYISLKNLNVFTLRYKNEGEVYDRGGESIRYRINGKDYNVKNSGSDFIAKEDAEAFSKSTNLIVMFAEAHRKPEIVNSGTVNDTTAVVIDKTDSSETVVLYKTDAPKSTQDDNVSRSTVLESEKTTGITSKMPNDFKIQYEMNGGISGEYRTILIQFGSCTDEGKKNGEAKYNKSWINKNLKNYESLYNALYKLNAFTLQYTLKGNANDRGGESVKYTLNKKEYIVSDMNNNYIKSSDKAAFKKVIGLILDFADKKFD